MPRVIVGAVGIVGLMLAVGGAAAQTLSCGEILGPGGVFTLQADLICDTAVGLTVRDGATLDLGGHAVDGFDVGVLLTGKGATLQNGLVYGGGTSVQVTGEGGHTVRDLDTGECSGRAGVDVVSDHNRVERTTGRSCGAGFIVQGDHNRLQQNTGIGQAGFVVEGEHNTLRQNVAPPVKTGFLVRGAGNRLQDNEVHGCGDGGIVVRGTANALTQNTATGNYPFDLIDSHEDCDDNRWAHNVFETSQAGDTVTPACIQ